MAREPERDFFSGVSTYGNDTIGAPSYSYVCALASTKTPD